MSYLIVNAARSAGTIRKTIYGQFSEHLGRCIYGGIADQDGALRPAVLQALKTLHIPVLRWPGGAALPIPTTGGTASAPAASARPSSTPTGAA